MPMDIREFSRKLSQFSDIIAAIMSDLKEVPNEIIEHLQYKHYFEILVRAQSLEEGRRKECVKFAFDGMRIELRDRLIDTYNELMERRKERHISADALNGVLECIADLLEEMNK